MLTVSVSAQNSDTLRNDNNDEVDRGFSWDRVFTGGSFGITAGSLTDIQLDPEFGYRCGKYLYAGIGIDYEYYNYSDPTYFNYSYTSQFIGANVFARYVVYKSIFAEAQFRETNWNAPQYDYLTNNYFYKNVTVPAFNIGAGYMEPVGRKSAFYFVALYDLLYSNNSPAPLPFAIEVGFNFGL